MASALEEARVAFDGQRWRAALEKFDEAAAANTLEVPDYEKRAVCAHLVGDDERFSEALMAGHRAALSSGDATAAARCAFWLAFGSMMQGKMAQAGGWMTRAETVIAESGVESVVSGYLLIPKLLGALGAGDPSTALDLARQSASLAATFREPDLRAFATLGRGQALLAAGDVRGATEAFDEAMVAVTAGEVGPITRGIVYCAVILECVRIYDFGRASEWTDALARWCDTQPDLVPFRGQCLVHRSQVQQAAGDWRTAAATAEAARDHLTDPPHPALGLAHYQEAELHRLVGDFDRAEASYRRASRHGQQILPGLALLQLMRGDAASAAAGIRGALEDAGVGQPRPALLAAAVEILRAAGDLSGARSAAEELVAVASGSSSAPLVAMASQAMGSVLTAEGDTRGAVEHLLDALRAWQRLRMPYESARAGVLLGLAYAATGERTQAALHFDNAREVFEEIGARPDLDRLSALTSGLLGTDPVEEEAESALPAGLSGREAEILAHVAAGMTNKGIAEALVISQHTVGRHLENIFTKLRVSSRAAATAWAYEHGMAGDRDL